MWAQPTSGSDLNSGLLSLGVSGDGEACLLLWDLAGLAREAWEAQEGVMAKLASVPGWQNHWGGKEQALLDRPKSEAKKK